MQSYFMALSFFYSCSKFFSVWQLFDMSGSDITQLYFEIISKMSNRLLTIFIILLNYHNVEATIRDGVSFQIAKDDREHEDM